MATPPDSTQRSYVPPASYPDNEDDKPIDGLPLNKIGDSGLPELVFGAANFSFQYNDEEHMTSDVPIRSLRLCMRYGIRAFDTSPYYEPSEIVLGNALKALKAEFPRESYKLITKCGRYGPNPGDFDYSPDRVEGSVRTSLGRLGTDYLDVVYLHDVEMVAGERLGKIEGDHSDALGGGRESYGLEIGQESNVYKRDDGEGDLDVLKAYERLKELKEQGLVKKIGITGYPLPTLLRLALLIQETYEPVDVIMSYCHLTLQNDTLISFEKEFTERAGVGQLITASPLCMGLLTPKPPRWNPGRWKLEEARSKAVEICSGWDGGLPNIALGFAYRTARQLGISTVVGMGSLEEIHETMRVWREAASDEEAQQRKQCEDGVIRAFEDSGCKNYSWPSP